MCISKKLSRMRRLFLYWRSCAGLGRAAIPVGHRVVTSSTLSINPVASKPGGRLQGEPARLQEVISYSK